MENTIENKAKFFALYWGLEYTGSDKYSYIMPDTWNEFPSFIDEQYLILKPISLISEEDLEGINFNFPMGIDGIELDFQPDNYKFHWKAKRGLKIIEGYLTLQDFDFLRSKGYALPWMGLSEEKQIEYGWVKLKGETK